MLSIKVAHECPLSLLEESLRFNDYCYALVHLFEEYPEYFDFFKRALLNNKEVILDNSLFELGEAYNDEGFAECVAELKPNYYIVPDVWENSEKTINKFDHWYKDLPGLKIGVVQGNSWNSMLECYRYMSAKADYIAVSFGLSYFNVTGEGNTVLERRTSGRQRFITQLISEGVWNWNKPHHLLGCNLAREFRFYINHNIFNIRSVDTSNPIVAAIHNLQYNGDLGLETKPETKLADLIETKLDNDQLQIMEYNVKMFKSILTK